MKSVASVSSIFAATLIVVFFSTAPATFARSSGRGGGAGIVGPGARHVTPPPSFQRHGHRPQPHRFHHTPRHVFGHRHHGHFGRSGFFFGLGASAFYPAWWWYNPYYYWTPPGAYYSGYSSYPYYDYYGDPYSSDPYSSDPCLSLDPAYAEYCPPPADPSQGEYGAPPVGYPAPNAPVQPESGLVSPSPPAPEQPN